MGPKKRTGIFKGIAYSFLALLLIVMGAGIFVGVMLYTSLPVLDGEQRLSMLSLPVTVVSDRYGIPTIKAQSYLDAVRALGYVTARDRLSQMDLARRLSGGRLSEVIGKAAVRSDKRQRVLGFRGVAKAIIAHLPKDQEEVLQAYTEGVNSFMEQMDTPPVEFLLLRYRPEPWTIEDSILLELNMFQRLNGGAQDERMMTIMEEVLPPEVVAFLTPDTDEHTIVLLGGNESHRPIRPIPVESMALIRRMSHQKGEGTTTLGHTEEFIVGSNNWAVDKSKTLDGRAILANDMHLTLSVPNIWYRATIQYEGIAISGVLIPGIPLVVAGSNGHVAWGFTNIGGDFLDFVRLEINPKNPEEYKTRHGWKRFGISQEIIKVKDDADVIQDIRLTIWGPVSEIPLMGQPVALHWTALDPTAVDIGLHHMNRAKTLEDAMYVMNRFKGPPLNAILADETGRIAWTYCGKIPIRNGFDGAFSKSWSEGDIGWQGYIPPDELPRVIDPPSGFLTTANNRTLGKDYPHVIGHNFDYSYRAHQISKKIKEADQITEQDMFQLQLDTTSDFYDFYRQLALDVLTEEVIADKPLLRKVRKHVEGWNGKAGLKSVGFGLLVRFREVLADDVFGPFLLLCREKDRRFSYAWSNKETPLRMMLTNRIPEILPDPEHFPDWDAFVLGKLEKAVQDLRKNYKARSLGELTWGLMNRAMISHPLGRGIPVLGKLLNMPRDPLPGGPFSIRYSGGSIGASQRLVVSPGQHEDGILHMPCGQSGHPFSTNYNDQHSSWVHGDPLPFLPGPTTHTLTLRPDL